MTRHKNSNWNLPDQVETATAKLAVLMDIRDELQTLNRFFSCHNTIGIPQSLKKIATNTNRIPRRKRK